MPFTFALQRAFCNNYKFYLTELQYRLQFIYRIMLVLLQLQQKPEVNRQLISKKEVELLASEKEVNRLFIAVSLIQRSLIRVHSYTCSIYTSSRSFTISTVHCGSSYCHWRRRGRWRWRGWRRGWWGCNRNSWNKDKLFLSAFIVLYLFMLWKDLISNLKF